MLDLTIDEKKAVVVNHSTGRQWTISTTDFFDALYSVLHEHFSDYNTERLAAAIVDHVLKTLNGNEEENPVRIFDELEFGESFVELQSFINDKQEFKDGRYYIDLSLKDVEEMRLRHFMTTGYLPVSLFEARGMSFKNLRTQIEVLIAVLYYYAFHGYKLTQCRHCGRWFATKTLKMDYCSRKSPYPGYERYSCKDAVTRIKDKLEKKRKAEYERMRLKANEFDKLSTYYIDYNDFCSTCDDYRAKLKACASVELLQEYRKFLYESKYVRRKYERLKNNGEWTLSPNTRRRKS